MIKLGICVAYDWELLRTSLPLVYEEADLICLSLDKNRRSWSGKPYEFDEIAFRTFIQQIDIQGKIRMYEDDFSLPQLSAIENDTRQRNLMARQMGEGGWHIQVDCDEHFVDFKGFVSYLKELSTCPNGKEKALNVRVNAIPILKETDKGFVFVSYPKKNYETFPIATNNPEYWVARVNGHFNYLSPFFVLHLTWARSEEEVLQKINSWGHDQDFANKESYFKLWKALDEFNCRYFRDFHPLQGDHWPSLGFLPSKTMDELVTRIKEDGSFVVPRGRMLLRNSRNLQRVLQVYRRLLE